MLIEAFRLSGGVLDPPRLLEALVLLTGLAVFLRRWRLALPLQGATVALIIFFGILPGSSWLALPLETRFPINPSLPSHIAGIIALGGGERLEQSNEWGQPILSDPTPIAALLALGRRYPEAKLVFSGGLHPVGRDSLTEAEIVRKFIALLNLDDGRILYEERARNTLENALFSRELVHPQPQEQWILVTQAISMPRAVGVFRHAGWNVIAFPAGYLSRHEANLSFASGTALGLGSAAVHEWGGLFVYRLMGYTDALFPKP